MSHLCLSFPSQFLQLKYVYSCNVESPYDLSPYVSKATEIWMIYREYLKSMCSILEVSIIDATSH